MTAKAIPLEQVLRPRTELTKTERLVAIVKSAKDTSQGGFDGDESYTGYRDVVGSRNRRLEKQSFVNNCEAILQRFADILRNQ